MSEQLFDVVFFGILQAGKDKEMVMQNMAALFKTDAAKLAPYFAGGRKVIKGNINADNAEKYRAALENVGLVIKIEPCEQQHDSAENDTAPEKAQSTSTTEKNPASAGASGNTKADNKADTSDITMAEVGADVL